MLLQHALKPCSQHVWTREQAKKSNYPIILTVILSIPAVFIAAFQQSPLPLAPHAVHVVSLIGCIDHQPFVPHIIGRNASGPFHPSENQKKFNQKFLVK
jgi:hypothetical protein